MTEYYVDDAAVGANNGSSPADAWTSVTSIVTTASGDNVNFAVGSGPYYGRLNVNRHGANFLLNGCEITGARDASESAYQWTQSSGGVNEWYLEASGGGDPSLVQAKCVTVDGWAFIVSAEASHTIGTPGSLADGFPGWGDNDSLGYNTVYIRSTNPNVLTVKFAQIDRIIDTGNGFWDLYDGILSYANLDLILANREGCTINDMILAYCDSSGIVPSNFTVSDIKINHCLTYWAGHNGITQATFGNTVVVEGHIDYGSHLGVRVNSDVPAGGSMTIRNSIIANGEAGAISVDNAVSTFVETNNCFYPRMTAGGGAIGYLGTANWATTDSTDFPPSHATTETNQANTVNPEFTAVSDNGYWLCDFSLKAASTIGEGGLPGWASAGPRPNDKNGEPWCDTPSLGNTQSINSPNHPNQL